MKAYLEIKELKRIIKALKPFTRANEEKMQYIKFDVDNVLGEIRFEALDGHRIAVEYTKCTSDRKFRGFIKPMVIYKTKNKTCSIEMVEDKAYIHIDDYSFGVKQPVGEWYKTEDMFKAHDDGEKRLIGINAEYLMDALKNQLANCSGQNRVILELGNDEKSSLIVRNIDNRKNVRMILPLSGFWKDR